MVCLYCARKTRVTNSRPHDKNYAIWRRRACTDCAAVFTTNEDYVLANSIMAESRSGKLTAFNKDLIFISLYESCKHRSTAAEDARGLTQTVITQLLQLPSTKHGIIRTSDILTMCLGVLHAFDSAAHAYYQAYYAAK